MPRAIIALATLGLLTACGRPATAADEERAVIQVTVQDAEIPPGFEDVEPYLRVDGQPAPGSVARVAPGTRSVEVEIRAVRTVVAPTQVPYQVTESFSCAPSYEPLQWCTRVRTELHDEQRSRDVQERQVCGSDTDETGETVPRFCMVTRTEQYIERVPRTVTERYPCTGAREYDESGRCTREVTRYRIEPLPRQQYQTLCHHRDQVTVRQDARLEVVASASPCAISCRDAGRGACARPHDAP